MAAFIGASADQVEEICGKVTKGYIVAANYNSPVQTVVSGSTAGVDEACEETEITEAEGLRRDFDRQQKKAEAELKAWRDRQDAAYRKMMNGGGTNGD